MDEQWYWLAGGRLEGPITTDELETLIVRGRIADTDRIRPASSEEWVSAREIKAMFKDDAGGSSSQAASQLLADANRRRLRRQVDAGAMSRRPTSRRWPSLLGGLGSLLDVVIGWIAGSFLHVTSRLGRKSLLGALTVVLLAILFRQVEFTGPRHRRTFDHLTSTWSQFEALEARQAPAGDWEQFRRETASWLQSALPDLEKSSRRRPIVTTRWRGSSSSDSAEVNRDLFLAARSLDALLKDQESTDTSGHRPIFLDSLSNAGRYFSGELPRPPTQQARAAPATTVANGDASWSPWMSGMIVVDVLLISAGIWWWRSRAA